MRKEPMKGPRVGDFLLGIQGLAILRAWSHDDGVVTARRHDIARILEEWDLAPFSADMSMKEMPGDEGYSLIAEGYDSPSNPIIATEEPVIRQILSSIPSGDVLDAACGTGRHVAFLHDAGHRVIGVDQNRAMLDKARERVPDSDLRIGSLEALPVEDESVDAVVCSLALTHVADLTKPIQEMARVLRDGGRLVISDVHPVLTMLGAHASARDEDGNMFFVRNHVHLISSYIEAFQLARLTITGCVEAPWGEPAWEAQTVLKVLPEAGRAATFGLPSVLVWETTAGRLSV